LVIGAALFKLSPDYMSTLFTDPMGQNMVLVGSLLMVIGAAIIKRMVEIKV
jgi:Flp pilus assembly protein TadB